MIGDLFSEYLERYGDPVLRFKPDRSKLKKIDIMCCDVPYECCVFKIDHVTEYMTVSRCSERDEWHANHGERAIIKHLIEQKGKDDGG